MSRSRRAATGIVAAIAVAALAAPATARADDPVTPDPTVLDVLDSVLGQNSAPSAGPDIPVGSGEVSLPG